MKNEIVTKFIEATANEKKEMLYNLYPFLHQTYDLANRIVLESGLENDAITYDSNANPLSINYMFYTQDNVLKKFLEGNNLKNPYSKFYWENPNKRFTNQNDLHTQRYNQDYAFSANYLGDINYSLDCKKKSKWYFHSKIDSYVELEYFNTRVDLAVQLIAGSHANEFSKNNIVCSSTLFITKNNELIRYTLEVSKSGQGFYIYQYKVGKQRHTSKFLKNVDGNTTSCMTEFLYFVKEQIRYGIKAEIFDYIDMMNYLSINDIKFEHMPDSCSDGEFFFLSKDGRFVTSKEIKLENLKATKINQKVKAIDMVIKENLKKPEENVFTFLNELMTY